MDTLHKPLSNMQQELLKMFSRDINDNDVIETKRLITKYFAEKSISEANKVWDEKNWTDEDMNRLLHTHLRTPYKSK